MGLENRDYYRGREHRGGGMSLRGRSVVFWLIAINVVVWIVQVAVRGGGIDLADILGCDPEAVFRRGHVWQFLTANFLHDPVSMFHLLGNMLFLFFFGRELELIYGSLDFLSFYLLAGFIAMTTQAGIGALAGDGATIIGASGSVMGVVVLYTLFYPHRVILLMGIFPMPLWVLCLLYIFMDVSGAISGHTGVAHLAHLAGGATGLLYRFFDLRLTVLLGRIRRRRGRRAARRQATVRISSDRPPGKVVFLSDAALDDLSRISARIDELLEKISRDGKDSLSEEELEYLKANSQYYKSPGR